MQMSHEGGVGAVVLGLVLTLLGLLATVSPVCSEYVLSCAPDPFVGSVLAVAGMVVLVAGAIILRKPAAKTR